MTENHIITAEKTIEAKDPILGKIIRSQKIDLIQPSRDYFASLSRSIISQQISVAAARTITYRFAEKSNYEPAKVIDLTYEDIRSIGLSKQKAGYIRDLAIHFVRDPDIYTHLEKLRDSEVITDLTQIKGIGVWTAQMFLIFSLARMDVFAPDDAGLQRSIQKHYIWNVMPAKKEIELFSERWIPYRTIASLHLWKSLEKK